MTQQWSNDKVIILIDFMEGNPLLWKITSRHYHKLDLKAYYLQRLKLLLAELMPNLTETEIPKKVLSIKKQYERENSRFMPFTEQSVK